MHFGKCRPPLHAALGGCLCRLQEGPALPEMGALADRPVCLLCFGGRSRVSVWIILVQDGRPLLTGHYKKEGEGDVKSKIHQKRRGKREGCMGRETERPKLPTFSNPGIVCYYLCCYWENRQGTEPMQQDIYIILVAQEWSLFFLSLSPPCGRVPN